MSFLGCSGGSKVKKAYLSKTFRCSIYEIARVSFGCSGGGRSKVTKALSFRTVQMFGL